MYQFDNLTISENKIQELTYRKQYFQIIPFSNFQIENNNVINIIS